MQFRLVEDKTLTMSDKDYKYNEYDIKQFLDRNNINYKIKDTNDRRTYNNYSDLDDDDSEYAETTLKKAHNVIDPQSQKDYIASFNPSLADKLNYNDKTSYYNSSHIYKTIVDFIGNEKFEKFIKTHGEVFADKPQSLRAIASILDNMALPINSIMSDTKFFRDSDDNIVFKIKSIALLSNKETRDTWATGGENQDILKNSDGQWLSADDMRQKLGEIESNKVSQMRQQKEEQEKIEQEQQAQLEADKKQADKEKRKAYRQDAKQRKKIDSQEEQKLLNKTHGYTGKDLLTKILKKSGIKKPDKQSIYDYAKSLIKKTSIPSMSSSINKLIDNGDFDDEFEEVLSRRYKSNLDKDSSNMLDRAIVKALNSGLDKTANPDESR